MGVIYYSPHGGEIFAVCQDPDPKFERHLVATGRADFETLTGDFHTTDAAGVTKLKFDLYHDLHQSNVVVRANDAGTMQVEPRAGAGGRRR